MPNFHQPVIIDRAVPVYRALLLECERRRQQLGWSMWQVDDASGLNDGHYAHCLHVDRVTGRQAQWKTIDLIVRALWPQGLDLRITHKTGGILTAENHRLKIMFAQADNNRLSRRELMRSLGKKGGEARREKYKTMPRAERLAIARKARKTRRQNRLLRAQMQKQQPELRSPL
jgi:hypothetical protein